MTATELPFSYVHSAAAFRSAFEHIHNVHHIRLMAAIHANLTTLFRVPEQNHEMRVRVGFAILAHIANSLEDSNVGPMRETFLRKLFGMGEQVLRYLEAAIRRRHQGEGWKGGIAGLREGFEAYGCRRTTSQKEQRHLRHYAVVVSTQTVFGMPVEALRRIAEACEVVLLCAGYAIQVRVQNSGEWHLPIVTRKDKQWEAEMQFYAIKSLQAAAQCFGHKFMRWPVEIRSEKVPGTGVHTGELLDDWVAV